MNSILKEAIQIQNQIINHINIDDLDSLISNYQALEKIIYEARETFNQLKLLKNSIKTYIVENVKSIDARLQIIEDRNSDFQDSETDKAPLVDGVNVPIVSVVSEELLPNYPLYYMESTGEFAIKILDTVFKGVIGNIGGTTSKKSYICKKNHPSNKACQYSHKIGESWRPSNWIYTQIPINAKNLGMRHIGSRDSLVSDIKSSTSKERHTRMRQTMHDLLIQLCITKIVDS